MAKINIDSIMKKIEQFANSGTGKAVIKEYIDDVVSGKKTAASDGGKSIVSVDTMSSIADDFIRILSETAEGHNLPQSVLDHFDSLRHTNPERLSGGDLYDVDVAFVDYLGRLSLYSTSTGSYTGGGINNIVALFNNGYSAGSQVYGEWHMHENLGRIKSLQQREGLRFIQEAIEKFEIKYASFGVSVVISNPYYM